MKHAKLILSIVALIASVTKTSATTPPYSQDSTYLALRGDMHKAFNEADSTAFFPALAKLEDYLLAQNDLHAYYTQRCNEIIFQMNRQRIFEAYMLARQLSHELMQKKLDSEMYMAVNMMGHIYRYCGNKEGARHCFEEVISRMEKANYRESMPPIYMNIVGVIMDDDPEEALRLLDKAVEIARETSPERVFDIETRRTLIYYSLGDTARFLEGYRQYLAGEQMGYTSVHGRSLQVFHTAFTGQVDQAVDMARETLGEDSYGTIADIYKHAGRWQEAYEALHRQMENTDSLNSVILANSMQGVRDELKLSDAERRAGRNRTVALIVLAGMLAIIVVSLVLLYLSRRHHMRQLRNAYHHALESDHMKSEFIQNVSHEVRTPLNIISGYAQVLADPTIDTSSEQRKDMAHTMMANTKLITVLIDEMLELSFNDSTGAANKTDTVCVNKLLQSVAREETDGASAGTVVKVQSSLPDDFTLLSNSRVLRRILMALTDNALKNTERGYIALRAEADDHDLHLAVEDTGCGIPAAEAEHIFERFVKLDAFKVGLGLGLPLCRALAQRLGANVELDTSYHAPESVGGPGARFVVTVPRY